MDAGIAAVIASIVGAISAILVALISRNATRSQKKTETAEVEIRAATRAPTTATMSKRSRWLDRTVSFLPLAMTLVTVLVGMYLFRGRSDPWFILFTYALVVVGGAASLGLTLLVWIRTLSEKSLDIQMLQADQLNSLLGMGNIFMKAKTAELKSLELQTRLALANEELPAPELPQASEQGPEEPKAPELSESSEHEAEEPRATELPSRPANNKTG